MKFSYSIKEKIIIFVTATIHILKDFFLLDTQPHNTGVVNPYTSRNLSVVSCRKLGEATPILFFNFLNLLDMKYCVYALHLDNSPIYVGMTSNLPARIRAHRSNKKEFDSVVKIECFDNKKDALICERGIIKFLSIFKYETITNGLYARFCNSLL